MVSKIEWHTFLAFKRNIDLAQLRCFLLQISRLSLRLLLTLESH